MSLVLMGSLITTAAAWEWDEGYAPSGDSFTWHMCAGNFTEAQEDELMFGANGWDAGASEVMRGALWDFVRGTDHAYNTCGPDDGDDEVYMRSASWFSDRGFGAAIGYCLCNDWDGLNDNDIAFRSSVAWSNSVPYLTNNTSIGQTALHEFGHLLGFLHEDTLIATMNQNYPFGGDISSVKYRPHEDDYVGLVAERPGSSTGRNLMLGRYVETSWSSAKVWNNATADWTVCNDEIAGVDGPEEIYAIIHGTAAQSPVIEWWLSVDDDCQAGPQLEVGSRTPTIGSNTPYLVQPTTYDFSGIAAGQYYLCAEIDPADLISETPPTDADNDLVSEVLVTVEDCP